MSILIGSPCCLLQMLHKRMTFMNYAFGNFSQNCRTTAVVSKTDQQEIADVLKCDVIMCACNDR